MLLFLRLCGEQRAKKEQQGLKVGRKEDRKGGIKEERSGGRKAGRKAGRQEGRKEGGNRVHSLRQRSRPVPLSY